MKDVNELHVTFGATVADELLKAKAAARPLPIATAGDRVDAPSAAPSDEGSPITGTTIGEILSGDPVSLQQTYIVTPWVYGSGQLLDA